MNIKAFLSEVYHNDIARRSFTKNGFDGVLTVLGVLIALFFAQVRDPSIIIFSCLGSGIAVGVSGLWGAYVTESAERTHKVKLLEKHLMRKLKGTKLSEASQRASLIVALVDGLTPLIFMLLLLTPFLIPITIEYAFYASFTLSIILVSLLGVFLARISKGRVLIYVLKMLSATLAISLILFLIEYFKVV